MDLVQLPNLRLRGIMTTGRRYHHQKENGEQCEVISDDGYSNSS